MRKSSKPLTVSKLIKALQKIEANGHGRCKVKVWKTTLDDGNDTFNCCEIYKVECQSINVMDGDGFHIENKDGSDRTSTVALLSGDLYE